MKPTKPLSLNQFRKETIEFAQEKPVLFAGIAAMAVITVFWLLSSFELLPENPRMRLPKGGAVVEQGDSMSWLDMRVIQLTRSLRKEFKVSKKIKGMFVLDEGLQLAKKYGVKTGDVIVSVGRKAVPTARAFVSAANGVQYREGILLDIYRDGKNLYITIPFEYQYGPLMGPNKGSWQLGAPVFPKALPYGPIIR